ncbi:MAG: LptF/LptG family permease [Spirochaetales bacterium]|nr:LptF/LptG family permease [Spirochaetales bacterium]
MGRSRSTHSILYRYITKEFIQNFIVAFIFFFCIFFVNSILLLVQKILLKNIDFSTMIEMVSLSMPQFLIYTFPFATLSSSSMVLGDLASQNELLAIRSCGIANRYIYRPLIIIAIIMSGITFIFADIVHPWASVSYRDKLALLMAEMPTFEIDSNSTNTVGDIVLYNGEAEGKVIHDIILLNNDPSGDDQVVLSEKGTLELIDPNYYIYSLSLDNPEILISDSKDIESYGLSKAEKATFFLDFSSQIPSLTSNSPVNLTSKELLDEIKIRNEYQKEDRVYFNRNLETKLLNISKNLKDLENGAISDTSAKSSIDNIGFDLEFIGDVPVNFYGQYYKAELTKKFALSAACLIFTLITLPLSNIKVRYGKLTGFAISLIVAVAYWYMLFAVQLFIFDIKSGPYLLISLPDILLFIVAIILLRHFRKAR